MYRRVNVNVKSIITIMIIKRVRFECQTKTLTYFECQTSFWKRFECQTRDWKSVFFCIFKYGSNVRLTASSVRLNCRQHRSLDSVIGSWRRQGANQRLRLGTRREFIHIHILANSQRARTSWRRATTPNRYNLKLWKECPPDTVRV